MAVRKQLFIATEKRERLTLRRRIRQTPGRAFCQNCQKEVDWLTLAEVSALTNKGMDEIKRQIVNGEFDFQITNDSRFLICAESVFGQ